MSGLETKWNDCSEIKKEDIPEHIHGSVDFTVDMNLLKNMLILSGQRIEGLQDYEIVQMGLNKLIPYGFNFDI